MLEGLNFELQITPDSSIPNCTEITSFTGYLSPTSPEFARILRNQRIMTAWIPSNSS